MSVVTDYLSTTGNNYRFLEQIPPVPFFTREEEDYLVLQQEVQDIRNSKFGILLGSV